MWEDRRMINEKDMLDFLKVAYFGIDNKKSEIEKASDRAYRDMNRTLRFNGLDEKIRVEFKEKVHNYFQEELKKLTPDKIKNQDDFDDWHKRFCDRIIKLYKSKMDIFTYGHAQKWINMTMKYLYLFEPNRFDAIVEYLHVPIDNIVFDIAKEQLEIINVSKEAWSKWDDYEFVYLEYQNELREKIKEQKEFSSPFEWEFKNWGK